MSELKFYECHGRDGAMWQDLIDALPYARRDIHFTPAYGRVQQTLNEGSVCAAIYRADGEHIIQPFVVRQKPHRDLTSLYGYGGPLPSLYGLRWAKYDEACRRAYAEAGILCEYGQLSPFLSSRQREFMQGVETTYVKDVVTVDIRKKDDDLLASFSRNRRRGVADATDRGVVVKTTPDWQQFADMYRQSMIKLKARDYWYYPDATWQAYLAELGPDRCTLFTAETSMLLVLHGYGKAYAHFLASTDKGNNDLLYFESMLYCRDAGCQVYHLGGGLTSNATDPLLAYKAGFSETRAPVYTYKRIFDEEAYGKACAGLPPTTYFPAYRAPNVDSAASVPA